MLSKLPEEYMQDQFDPVLFELQQLPTSFDEQMLDTIVDSRASVLEVRNRQSQCLYADVCQTMMLRFVHPYRL